jgi:hypothetical protein
MALPWAAASDGPVRKRLKQLTTGSVCPAGLRLAQVVLDAALGKRASPVINPSFESGSGSAPASWSLWNKPEATTGKPVGQIRRDTSVARTGKASVVCDGIYRGGPHQTVSGLQAGDHVVLAWARISGPVPAGSWLELSLTPLDSLGKNLTTLKTTVPVPAPGSWSLVVLGGATVPAGSTRARIVLVTHGFKGGGKVWWDDVALFRTD